MPSSHTPKQVLWSCVFWFHSPVGKIDQKPWRIGHAHLVASFGTRHSRYGKKFKELNRNKSRFDIHVATNVIHAQTHARAPTHTYIGMILVICIYIYISICIYIYMCVFWVAGIYIYTIHTHTYIYIYIDRSMDR